MPPEKPIAALTPGSHPLATPSPHPRRGGTAARWEASDPPASEEGRRPQILDHPCGGGGERSVPHNDPHAQQAPLALVTGGGSGIGRGIALALARRGVDLALVGRRPAPLTAVANAAIALGVRAVALPTDLADPAERDALLDRTRTALGSPTLLVHAAGLLAGGELADLDLATIDRAIATNLAAPIALTRAALPDLLAKRGAIILVASLTADVPFPAATLYSATKAGIVAFGEALRHEIGPRGVRVLVAYPPATATAMTRGMARAAGLRAYSLADPHVVGEAIVAALLAGRRTWHGSAGDSALTLAHRLAPAIIRPLLRSQRARFRRMMTAPAAHDTGPNAEPDTEKER